MTDEARPDNLDVDGTSIAVRHRAGAAPTVVWLGGFRSDMAGSKALALDEWAVRNGRACLRHDYSGHGISGGAFADGTISKWLRQSLAVFRAFTGSKAILVGSSMGAWIALRMVQELAKTGDGGLVAGLVLIAPAPDFSAALLEPKLTKAQRRALDRQGFFEVPSAYAPEPTVYTRDLIEDGRANLVMGAPIDTWCPVHIIQGMQDPDVPYAHALKLASLLPADDVTLSLVPDGDHRLSRPQDIAMILEAVDALVQRAPD